MSTFNPLQDAADMHLAAEALYGLNFNKALTDDERRAIENIRDIFHHVGWATFERFDADVMEHFIQCTDFALKARLDRLRLPRYFIHGVKPVLEKPALHRSDARASVAGFLARLAADIKKSEVEDVALEAA